MIHSMPQQSTALSALRVFNTLKSGKPYHPNIHPALLPRRSFKQICYYVCKKHGITMDELHMKTRAPRVAYARHEVYYLGRLERKFSYTWMALKFGQNHTTAVYGARAHHNRLYGLNGHLRHHCGTVNPVRTLRLPAPDQFQ